MKFYKKPMKKKPNEQAWITEEMIKNHVIEASNYKEKKKEKTKEIGNKLNKRTLTMQSA